MSAARSSASQAAHLDVDLVAQYGCPQNHGLGTSLELFAHQQGLLKGGAALIHVSSIQYLYRQERRFSVAQQVSTPHTCSSPSPAYPPCCVSRCGR